MVASQRPCPLYLEESNQKAREERVQLSMAKTRWRQRQQQLIIVDVEEGTQTSTAKVAPARHILVRYQLRTQLRVRMKMLRCKGLQDKISRMQQHEVVLVKLAALEQLWPEGTWKLQLDPCSWASWQASLIIVQAWITIREWIAQGTAQCNPDNKRPSKPTATTRASNLVVQFVPLVLLLKQWIELKDTLVTLCTVPHLRQVTRLDQWCKAKCPKDQEAQNLFKKAALGPIPCLDQIKLEQRGHQVPESDRNLQIKPRYLELAAAKVSRNFYILISSIIYSTIDLITKNRIRPGSPNTQSIANNQAKVAAAP